jgi:hypothetical protein
MKKTNLPGIVIAVALCAAAIGLITWLVNNSLTDGPTARIESVPVHAPSTRPSTKLIGGTDLPPINLSRSQTVYDTAKLPPPPPEAVSPADRRRSVKLAHLPKSIEAAGVAPPPEQQRTSRFIPHLSAATPTLLPDEIATARKILHLDPRLLAWFDQWQVDHSIGRTITDAQLEELRNLASASPIEPSAIQQVGTLLASLDERVAKTWTSLGQEKKP